MAQPKWAGAERQAYLVRLFLQSGGFCVYGHKCCPIPEHYYEVYIEEVIHNWQLDDRAQRQAEWEAERKALHSLNERVYPTRGQFNALAKDIYLTNQPQHFLIGLGISGVTFRPFAKVRLASSYIHLHINLGNTLRKVSKSKRRKAIRYGKALPIEIQKEVDRLISLAVRDYLTH